MKAVEGSEPQVSNEQIGRRGLEETSTSDRKLGTHLYFDEVTPPFFQAVQPLPMGVDC
jgi:hypothetical protein